MILELPLGEVACRHNATLPLPNRASLAPAFTPLPLRRYCYGVSRFRASGQRAPHQYRAIRRGYAYPLAVRSSGSGGTLPTEAMWTDGIVVI